MISLRKYIKNTVNDIKFVSSETNKPIQSDAIITYVNINKHNVHDLFNKILSGYICDTNKCYICFGEHNKQNSITVQTENMFNLMNTPDGALLVNMDDDREIYDESTLQNFNSNDVLIVFHNEKI